MNNQQKIEFYLSKGFAVEVEIRCKIKIIIYFVENSNWFYGTKDGNGQYWTPEDMLLSEWQTAKLTPIPPKLYEFNLEDRAIIVKTGEIERISAIDRGGISYHLVPSGWHKWYELAPALPEDEVEVVELDCEDIRTLSLNCKNFITITKPDGKKLKIKVIKP